MFDEANTSKADELLSRTFADAQDEEYCFDDEQISQLMAFLQHEEGHVLAAAVVVLVVPRRTTYDLEIPFFAVLENDECKSHGTRLFNHLRRLAMETTDRGSSAECIRVRCDPRNAQLWSKLGFDTGSSEFRDGVTYFECQLAVDPKETELMTEAVEEIRKQNPRADDVTKAIRSSMNLLLASEGAGPEGPSNTTAGADEPSVAQIEDMSQLQQMLTECSTKIPESSKSDDYAGKVEELKKTLTSVGADFESDDFERKCTEQLKACFTARGKKKQQQDTIEPCKRRRLEILDRMQVLCRKEMEGSD
jgi:hypothetical protein